MKRIYFGKSMTLIVILLFIGFAFAPSINANINNDTNSIVYKKGDRGAWVVISGIKGENDWFISCISILFTWSSDVVKIWYQIDGGNWIEFPVASYFSFCEDGEHVICWKYEDIWGNISEVECKDFKIDLTPPDIQDVRWDIFRESWCHWYCKFVCNATDNTSGMDRVEMYVNDGLYMTMEGSGPIYEFVIQWGTQLWGKPIFSFLHYDIAGNSASSSINASDIISYSKILEQKSGNHWYHCRLIECPLLQRLLERLIR